jgi:TonB family protein
MKSLPTNQLPLADLLRFAADNQLTTALDLRSDLTAGRIDIRDGEIIDAKFGGLVAEQAVYAALRSGSLSVIPGRAPRRSAPKHVTLTTNQLLLEAARECPSFLAVSELGSTTQGTPPSARKPRRPRRKYLRMGLFGILSAAALTTLGAASWRWMARAAIDHDTDAVGTMSPSMDMLARNRVDGEFTPPRMLTTESPKIAEVGLIPPSTMNVQVLVDETGAVTGAKIAPSRSEFAAFEDAAIAFLMRARFEPAKLGGRPVSAWTDVPVTFGPTDGRTASDRHLVQHATLLAGRL